MKRTIIAASVLALGLAGTGVSFAGPGPNENNNRGLCTAYFSGSENGQENKRKAGPFAALEKAADEASPEPDGVGTPEEVLAFCDATAPGHGNNGNGGGAGGGKDKGAEDPA